ncbi:tRNA1(Val) (adenine(37)-N6)-methyltransferase [Mesonia ostreae]|uniref:tRNA1(Val) (adenine(37)-N6)-methyltransferase n=1 Tax=Mesonia ostreae TaxID=861110 RepID=A0ABU2KHD6_9FLAO|nr:methyltransferase [Mesonia ostreae]MDT0294104.1 methyltransferase [Mesonia ostreae]
MSQDFRFKEFTIKQDRCAMKIGTDGVLLGAWAHIPNTTYSILDIGAGTGVIALMLAQRSQARLIDALEIDEDAYEQCVDNFENSPWGDRLFCYHADLDEFTEEFSSEEDETNENYDLIVSNPPYFAPALAKETSEARKKARFYDALPFEDLLTNAVKLLAKDGTFQTIIPFAEYDRFIFLAQKVQLNLQRVTWVKGNQNAPVKRVLLQLGFEELPLQENTLIIEKYRHVYTEEYIGLVKDFYLKL